MPEGANQRWSAFALAAAVFALDRFTKWIVETRVSAFDDHVVVPGFFSIIHSQNRGAAFGILADAAPEWRAIFLVIISLAAVAFIGAMIWRARGMDRLTLLGLSLILGGALGNVFDRVVRGSVTDFLLFYIGEYHWPAFNVADSAITTGCGLLLLEMFRPRKRAAQT